MAVTDILFKGGKDIFLNKVAVLEGNISWLENIKSRYEALMANLDSEVIEQSDDNFSKMEEAVRQNIEAVTSAISMCRARRQELQDTAQGIEEVSQNTASTLNSAIDTAVDSAKIAKTVLEFLG